MVNLPDEFVVVLLTIIDEVAENDIFCELIPALVMESVIVPTILKCEDGDVFAGVIDKPRLVLCLRVLYRITLDSDEVQSESPAKWACTVHPLVTVLGAVPITENPPEEFVTTDKKLVEPVPVNVICFPAKPLPVLLISDPVIVTLCDHGTLFTGCRESVVDVSALTEEKPKTTNTQSTTSINKTGKFFILFNINKLSNKFWFIIFVR